MGVKTKTTKQVAKDGLKMSSGKTDKEIKKTKVTECLFRTISERLRNIPSVTMKQT